MKFEREVACLVEAFEPKCFQDTFTHELDVCARRRTRATRPLPRRDGQERGDASDPTPDKCIVLQQNIVFTNLFTTIFGAELVWRWTKALKNVIYTAFLTGACGSWARHLRVRAPHVVHPEQHLVPFPGSSACSIASANSEESSYSVKSTRILSALTSLASVSNILGTCVYSEVSACAWSN